ncbi:MAG TPA: PP2C family protein-serine/threonine phosphatase [Thermoanaerobaculia bacterium]|nr:PP2C family protein-serine/threonine phosphatase [Thermoanaerobaculia bacterium]
MKDRPPRRLRAIISSAILVAALPLVVLAFLGIPYVTPASQILLGGIAVLGLLWLLWKAYRAFLYKVGRRLAFSYFLLGVLPIPLVLLLLTVVAYILSGYYLGQLYREGVQDLQTELRTLAQERATHFARTGRSLDSESQVVFGYYRNGRRVAGDPRLPRTWPAWLEQEPDLPHFVEQADGISTLAAAASSGGTRGTGVVALWTGSLDQEISRRSDLWVEIGRPDDPNLVQLEFFGRTLPLRRINQEKKAAESEKFFKQLSRDGKYWDRPILWWGEISGPLRNLATGRMLLNRLTVTLTSTPRTVQRHLFVSSAEVNSAVWASLLIFAILLFDVYVIAALMAVFMIVGLSRAVNRLSQATTAVRSGDFGVRIPVRRRDQVGDLQRSFNEMAAHLESSVTAAAQKEILEKELQIARNVQTSLIPSNLPTGEGIEFATLFEPSAAIGGDYFDVLRLSDTEIAVVIADVSGHGLSTGLRMAMLKAALLILIEETRDPEEILRRLDSVVRNSEDRTFVTATLAIVDLHRGTLRLTNAGHPPTYLIRGRQVQEILLPGSPLGGLGHTYGKATVPLEPGDLVVWLSDGLIEAEGDDSEPFGYDRVAEALAAGRAGQTAYEVRDRLLAAIGGHVGERPPSDDRTLVIMQYRSSGALTGEMRLSDIASALAEARAAAE